jgi:hypothetical protein
MFLITSAALSQICLPSSYSTGLTTNSDVHRTQLLSSCTMPAPSLLWLMPCTMPKTAINCDHRNLIS